MLNKRGIRIDIFSWQMAVGLIGEEGGGGVKGAVVFQWLFYFSVNSFIALRRLLLNEEEIKFLLFKKLSQDPLEEYFSKFLKTTSQR